MLGAGFSLTYLAVMAAMLVGEASRFDAVRSIVLGYGCLPAFVVGTTLLAVSHLAQIRDNPAIEAAGRHLT
jgi:hypothetical protein